MITESFFHLHYNHYYYHYCNRIIPNRDRDLSKPSLQ
jgi:hypothetical protein